MVRALLPYSTERRSDHGGFIYDSTTKKPISRAIIRLIREDGTISDTVVSEANGSFRLTPKVGKFKISVTHQQYTFPSKAIKGDTDAGYTNIYLGETINITDVNNGLLLSIPLDPVNLSEADKQAIARKKMFDQAVSFGSTLLMVGGLMYSIYVSVIYPQLLQLPGISCLRLNHCCQVSSCLCSKKESRQSNDRRRCSSSWELNLVSSTTTLRIYSTEPSPQTEGNV